MCPIPSFWGAFIHDQATHLRVRAQGSDVVVYTQGRESNVKVLDIPIVGQVGGKSRIGVCRVGRSDDGRLGLDLNLNFAH